jgi:hypothetical protein
MEKLIEDLMLRLEKEKAQSFRVIENLSSEDKSLECIHKGKIFAFSYCVNELERMIEYQKISNQNQSNKK